MKDSVIKLRNAYSVALGWIKITTYDLMTRTTATSIFKELAV